MKIEEMTNKEVIEKLKNIQKYFESPLFENNRSIINALEVAVEEIENKEKSNKTPFDRVNDGEYYFMIDSNNEVLVKREDNLTFDNKYFENFNYFNDKEFAKQVMLHQLLYRKLLKFKLGKEKEDKKFGYCFFINIDANNLLYVAETFVTDRNCNGLYFNECDTAELALKEVVEPFLKEYPDFIWNL